MREQHGDARFRTIAVDLDGKAGRSVPQAREQVRAVLQAGGARFAETRSTGRGERTHFLLTFPQGVEPAEAVALGRALKRLTDGVVDTAPLSRSRLCAIRPPLSPHRAGGRSEVVGDELQALATLQEGNSAGVWPRLAEAAGVTEADREWAHRRLDQEQAAAEDALTIRRPLPRRWERGWIEGTRAPVAADYGSTKRSELLMALAIVCIRHGWTFQQFAERCRDARYMGGDRARRSHSADCPCRVEGLAEGRPHRFERRDADKVTDEILTFWDAGRLQVGDQEPAPEEDDALSAAVVEDRVDAVLAAMYRRGWPGRQGVHARQLVAYLASIALATGRIELRGSVRSWATAAGMSKSTVHRVIPVLEAGGWLRLADVSTQGRTYELTAPQEATASPSTSENTSVPNGTLVLPPQPPTHRSLQAQVQLRAHDVFDWQGLGDTAGLIISEIPLGGATTRELCTVTGLSPQAVRKHLYRGVAARLVTRDRAGRWTRLPADLDAVARRLGTLGRGAWRAGLYEAERITFGWLTSDRQARAGWAVERGLYDPDATMLPNPALGGLALPGYPRRQRGGQSMAAWTEAREHVHQELAAARTAA
ncbi:helix-turn-helix domain-containing protein [Kitasatospora sp. NPDC001527]|uniref:helix-turn-helix domain-containing protein n=1 Tax=Kitasatospora sp. NPDC001527 TaxID=3154519 RepID=UPI00331DD36A